MGNCSENVAERAKGQRKTKITLNILNLSHFNVQNSTKFNRKLKENRLAGQIKIQSHQEKKRDRYNAINYLKELYLL